MSVLRNKLYDSKKQNQPWRKYSPEGKRRKVTNIPYKGRMPSKKITAQGTKVAPVLGVRFSYMDSNIASFVNLGVTGSSIRPISEYTKEEMALLSPEQKRVAIEKQVRQEKEDERRARADSRASYRAGLDTFREGRGWINTIKGVGTETRGWLRTAQDFNFL